MEPDVTLCIFAPSLGTTDETVERQIVLYERRRLGTVEPLVTDLNEQLRTVGLAQGMMEFSRAFDKTSSLETVTSVATRAILLRLEADFTMIIVYPAEHVMLHDSMVRVCMYESYQAFCFAYGSLMYVLESNGLERLREVVGAWWSRHDELFTLDTRLYNNGNIPNGVACASITLNSSERIDACAASIARVIPQLRGLMVTTAPAHVWERTLMMKAVGMPVDERFCRCKCYTDRALRLWLQRHRLNGSEATGSEPVSPWYSWKGSAEWTRSLLPSLGIQHSDSHGASGTIEETLDGYVIGYDDATSQVTKVTVGASEGERIVVYVHGRLCFAFFFLDTPQLSLRNFYDTLAQYCRHTAASVPVGEPTLMMPQQTDFYHLILTSSEPRAPKKVFCHLPLLDCEYGSGSEEQRRYRDALHLLQHVFDFASSCEENNKEGSTATVRSHKGQWIMRFMDTNFVVYLAKRRHVAEGYQSRSLTVPANSGDSVEDVERDARRYFNRLKHNDLRIWNDW